MPRFEALAYVLPHFDALTHVAVVPQSKSTELCSHKVNLPARQKPEKVVAEDLFSNVQVNWENTYQLPFLCTKETKLRVFQFKFLHKRVATNDFLRKIGKRKQTPVLFALVPQRHLRIFFGTVDQLLFFE